MTQQQPAAVPAPAAPRGLPAALLSAARPRQWVKNLVVVAGPLASGLLLTDGVAARTATTVVAFTLLAAGVYYQNDLHDRADDAAHPHKRSRAIAAGQIPVPVAVAATVALIVGGLLLALLVGWPVLAVCATYVVLNLGYSWGLREVAVVDLLIVASGFLLRGLAGAYAVPVRPTVWFTLLAIFGSLLLVSGKRSGEKAEHGTSGRPSLDRYTDSYLSFVREFSAAGLLMAYGLMAFERSSLETSGAAEFFLQVSIVPFLAGVLLLVYRMDRGGGAAPEELALRDRALQATGVVWLLCFALGVYL